MYKPANKLKIKSFKDRVIAADTKLIKVIAFFILFSQIKYIINISLVVISILVKFNVLYCNLLLLILISCFFNVYINVLPINSVSNV